VGELEGVEKDARGDAVGVDCLHLMLMDPGS